MPNTMTSNAIVSFILITIMGILAYQFTSIDAVMDIAAGFFGIPMIYLFPTLVCIKCNYYKTSMGKIFLYLWTGLWLIFILLNIGIMSGLIKTGGK